MTDKTTEIDKSTKSANKTYARLKARLTKNNRRLKGMSSAAGTYYRKLKNPQTLLAFGLIALLALGVLGEATDQNYNKDNSDWGIWSSITNALGFSDSASNSNADTIASTDGSLQLSKEYIYAGSRMLAVEDYGIAPTPTSSPTATPPISTPTPTPTVAPTSTPTPVPTATPTPTPTPAPNATTGCPYDYTALGGIISSEPTASVFDGQIFVFANGTDNAMYYKTSSDGSTFSAWGGLLGGSYNNPMSLVSGSTLYVEVIGTDNNPYYNATSDGTYFSGWIQGTVSATTHASVSFNNQTYTFIRGAGGTQPNLCMKVE